MKRTQSATLWILSAALVSCAKGKEPPAVTTMVPVTTNLEFYVGDETPCTGFGDAPYECGTECKNTGGVGCVSVSTVGPPTKVKVDAFCIDEHEVTNLQYLYCEESEKCPEREFFNLKNLIEKYGANSQYYNHPANLVRYAEAKAYCRFVGKRLPTAFEWERVAGGAAQNADLTDKRLYPFLVEGENDPAECEGRNVAINVCRNASQGTTLAVKTSSDDVIMVNGDSGAVYDLGGNFYEWTSTLQTSTIDLNEPLTCAPFTSAECNPANTLSAPNCGAGESISNSECCECGGDQCHRICANTNLSLAVCARRFPDGEVVSQNDDRWLPPSGTFKDSRIVKGGAYDMSPKNFCQARTSAWARQAEIDGNILSIGLRCAADIGTPHCPAP